MVDACLSTFVQAHERTLHGGSPREPRTLATVMRPAGPLNGMNHAAPAGDQGKRAA